MSRRSKIVNTLVSLVNTNIDGTIYTSNIYGGAENKLKFWDEIGSFPYLSIVAGDEYREYQPGNFKWAYLNCVIRIYTKGEYPEDELEQFFEDLEDLLDKNNNIEYETGEDLTSISITSITTDEGVLKPIGVGEMNLQVRYPLQGPCPI
ncbi:MAG: hypothetical protein GY707_05170 [Desulfobacteraceae bacterium]|nr:hypothetical protein [Desulfobacteraceae bacterium]